MRKYLNSPEQLIIALKRDKAVYKENSESYFKQVEGVICVFNDGGCLYINSQIVWAEDSFYIIE